MRFARAWGAGALIAAVIFTWMITSATGDLFRRQRLNGDFYDAQARSILHGNLAISAKTLGIEAFAHNGKTYTYFPPAPAVLRIPVIALTSSLDGRLAAPYMLLAFALAMAGTGVLVWRVRGLVRQAHPLGRAELWCSGLFALLVGLGSPMIFMASRAWVYHEAALWGMAFAICAYDQIVALMVVPTRRRLVRASAFAGASVLSRATIGSGALLALALVLLVLVLVRLRPSLRGRFRFLGLPNALFDESGWITRFLLAVGIPVVVYAAINEAKFGTLFGVPYGSQLQTLLDAHRRRVLAANGGSLFNLRAISTQLLQLGRPDALHWSGTFPWVGFSTTRPHVVGNVAFDQLDYTASVTAAMPALVILGVIGIAGVVRRQSLAVLRVSVVAAVMILPVPLSIVYVAQRYTSDVFLPMLLLAVAGLHVGLARLDGRSAAVRRMVLAAVGAVVILGCWTSTALALVYQRVLVPFVPDAERRQFVAWQSDIAEHLGTGAPPIAEGAHLPRPGPRGALFAVDDCAGLYTSDGDHWAGVERTHSTGQFRLRIAFPHRPAGTVEPIVTSGSGAEKRTLAIRYLHDGRGAFTIADHSGIAFDLDLGKATEFDVLLDRRIPEMHVIQEGRVLLGAAYDGTSDEFTVGHDPDDPSERFTGRLRSLPVRSTLCPVLLARAR